ncbi:MAG: HlyD family efflux transporter periplasmic adaptor subunit [Rhodothermales bacterium]|nr:HlyD family efflux transporter periplasmic adaptor subunit [Rhodothermales bacterium]
MSKLSHAQPRKLSVALTYFAVVLLAGCSGTENNSDAYGNFEVEDIIVSSEGTGKLIRFDVREGDIVAAGTIVGVVDTVQLALQRQQLIASQAAVRSRIPGVVSEMNVLEEERRVAAIEKTRIENLLARGAATQKQQDDIDGRIAVIDSRIRSIKSKHAPILAEVEVLKTQVAQVNHQIDRSVIVNPISGTVLTTYVDANEVTAPGRPLYKIASLDTLVLRAYVSGDQLSGFSIGDDVTVLVDRDADSSSSMKGRIVWVASEAEFTPRMIQTKDERVNLMYAIKVLVPNAEQTLKIGMPGEVVFGMSQEQD